MSTHCKDPLVSRLAHQPSARTEIACRDSLDSAAIRPPRTTTDWLQYAEKYYLFLDAPETARIGLALAPGTRMRSWLNILSSEPGLRCVL